MGRRQPHPVINLLLRGRDGVGQPRPGQVEGVDLEADGGDLLLLAGVAIPVPRAGEPDAALEDALARPAVGIQEQAVLDDRLPTPADTLPTPGPAVRDLCLGG
jgi:hypothetical protein